MARKRESTHARLSRIVWVLVLAVTGFCILTSWSDKHGGLPESGLRTPGFLQDFLDGFAGEESGEAEEVPLSGALPDAKLEVHFLDVGQAESILIKGPDASMLIDAGENGQGEEVLRYLKGAGVSKLDYVVGTHPHSDHIGGLDEVIRELRVEQVILPDLPDEIVPTTQTYTDLLLAISKKGLKITPAKPGRTYSLGDGAEVRILGPAAQYSDLNNMSVICRLTYGETAFLFTGDAGVEAEQDILDSGASVVADVLNAGHHGSNTSTGPRWLEAVSPRVAVISCGVDNSYGHPHREVIAALEAREIRILRTDRNGAVVIASNGKRLAVTTQR